LDDAPKLDVLFVDEAHFGGAELDRVIRHYQAQGSWVIGLSATPMKTSGQGMGDWYDTMVQGPSIRWLMDNGRLSGYRLFAPDVPDLSGIKTVAGDYAKGQLADYMEHDRVLIGNAARHYAKHAMGRLDVVFCTSIKHAEITCQVFKDAGIAASYVHGKLDDAEIAKRVKAFARREILALCSVDLLTFGFDLSQAAGMDVTVECLSDLRPTKSLPLQLQKWGRALRMKSQPAMIFDHAGNSRPDMHGLPDSEREWTLEGKKKRNGCDERTEPTRQCPECYFVHRPTPLCPNCGFQYPVMAREVEEVEGELREVTDCATMKPKQEIGMIARTEGLRGLMEYGKQRGYKPTWAYHQMKVRGLA
jgi:superfamily II DNA or RNA helicase